VRQGKATEGAKSGDDGHNVLTGVAGEGKEEVGFSEVTDDSHCVEISLCHVSWTSGEAGGQDGDRSPNVFGIKTTLQGVGETKSFVLT